VYQVRLRSSPPPKVGSIVLFTLPTTGESLLIKRVLASEGDSFPVPDTTQMSVVPNGHIYVLGDNPTWSLDSRQLGAIPVESVVGTVFWRFPVGREMPPKEQPRVVPLSPPRRSTTVEPDQIPDSIC
jgi:hypothetical protein